MKAHRHAWVDCTHEVDLFDADDHERVSCGLDRCVYCGRKRRRHDWSDLNAFDENGTPMEDTA